MSGSDHPSENSAGGGVADAVVSARVATDAKHVWLDFTEVELFRQWFWPPSFEATAAMDPVAGGAWSVHSASAGMGAAGRFLVVDSPRFLRMSWQWDGEPEVTTVTILLEVLGQSTGAMRDTVVTVRQSGHTSELERANHEQGWRDCLARLEERHR